PRAHSRAELLVDAVLVLEHHVDAADVEERLLGDVVELAVADALEALDRVLQRDVRAVDAGELLRKVGVLREELLDPSRTGDGDLVLLGELVDAEHRDDVLQDRKSTRLNSSHVSISYA